MIPSFLPLNLSFGLSVFRYCCKPLLRSCPAVERATINDCDDIRDDEFFDILSVNPLAKCEDLNLLSAGGLTIQTARCIMTCLDR